MRRSTDVEPEPGAWDGVRSGVRRAQRIRVAVSSVAALALIGAGIFVVPRLMNRDSGSTPVQPGPSVTTPSPTLTPTGLPAGWSVLRYDEQAYWLTVPDSWKTGWFEGHAEYRPPGLPGLTVGEDTFAVETFGSDGIPQPEGDPEALTINGSPAKRWETPSESGAYTVTFEIDLPCYTWPGYTWPGSSGVIDCAKVPLRVVVYASTADLWTEHGEAGERVARSITFAERPMPAAATTYRTFNGSSSVEWDAKTWAVVQFMQSRIFGDVERGNMFLTANAKQQYDDHAGGLDRYDPDSSRRMVTYSITARAGADANSDEFTVRITEASLDGSNPESTYSETLGVGPAETNKAATPFQIRFAVRDNG
ncbi:MAG TPA: hypothetical protein VGB64_01190 [Actinomycetota bacterium]